MDVGSVLEVETEAESEDSDGSEQSVDNIAAQELLEQTSEEEEDSAPPTAPGPNRAGLKL